MKALFLIGLVLLATSLVAQKRVVYGIGGGVMDASVTIDEYKSTDGYACHLFMDLYTSEVGLIRFMGGFIDRGFSYTNQEVSIRETDRHANVVVLKGWDIPTSEKCHPLILIGPSYDFHKGNPLHFSANLQFLCAWKHFEVGADLQKSINNASGSDDSEFKYQNLGLRMNVKF
jgi:hypothetical protein